MCQQSNPTLLFVDKTKTGVLEADRLSRNCVAPKLGVFLGPIEVISHALHCSDCGLRDAMTLRPVLKS